MHNYLINKSIVIMLIVLLGQFQSSFAGQCKEGETIRSSSNIIVGLGKADIADSVGYCANHAYRDLLHQAICKNAKTPEECFQPAVLDLLNIDASADAKHIGTRNSSFALEAILQRRTISTESCLDFEKMFQHEDHKQYLSYEKKFKKATNDVIINECKRQKKSECALNAGVVPSDIKKLLDDCEVLAKTRGTDLIYSAVQWQKKKLNCPENSIPKLTLKRIDYDKNIKNDATSKLNKILESGNQARILIKGPHAFVISNYRMQCVNGVETLQYQTLDSLYGRFTSLSKKPGDWVDGEKLIKRLINPANFEWLEASSQSGDNSTILFKTPQNPGDPASIYGIKENSLQWRAGLRDGMNFGKSEIDESTGATKVWIKQDDGTFKIYSYPKE